MKNISNYIKVNYKTIILILVVSIIIISTGIYILYQNGVIDFNRIYTSNNTTNFIQKQNNTKEKDENNIEEKVIEKSSIEEKVIEKSDKLDSGAVFNITKDEFIEKFQKAILFNTQNELCIEADEKFTNIVEPYKYYTYFIKKSSLAGTNNFVSIVKLVVDKDTDKITEIDISGVDTDKSWNEMLICANCIFNNHYFTKAKNNIEILKQKMNEQDYQTSINYYRYDDNVLYMLKETQFGMQITMIAYTEDKYHIYIEEPSTQDFTASKNTVKDFAISKETATWTYTNCSIYRKLHNNKVVYLVKYKHNYYNHEYFYMFVEVSVKENTIVKYTDIFPDEDGFIESMYKTNWKE